jgi:hypothetical protein
MRLHLAVFPIAAIAAAGFLLAGSGGNGVANAASTAPASGIGLIRTGGGAGTADNWDTLTNTDKYGISLVGQADALQAGQLPGRALTWGCGVNIVNAAWSGTCGVSWTTAVANNWLLKDANGNYVPYGDGYTYLADIGNPSYQQAWITAMNSIMASEPGIDGVIIDNITGSLITASPKYPDNASYRTAMKSFMDAVGPALRAKGWYVAVNASITDTTTQGWSTSLGNQCDGSQYLWWYQQIAPDVDGLIDEYWLMNWDSSGSLRLSGTTSCNQNWDGWQRIAGAVEAMGKDFIPLTSGTSDAAGVNKSTFLKASFLLDYNGGTSAFIYSAGGPGNYATTADNWMNGAAWTLDIGQAAAAKYQVGVGWRRNFSGGTVLVDPSPTMSQTFALGGTYVLPSGSSTTSVTLTPGSALILRSAPTVTTTTTTTTTSATTTTASTATTTTSTTSTPPPVAVALAPSNVQAPTISGPTMVGKTLTASIGTWSNSPTSYGYLWSRCSATGANCTPINGATSSTYPVNTNDTGLTLVVTVIATNAIGSASATSAPTAAVRNPGSNKSKP